jgi:hypothetical protein
MITENKPSANVKAAIWCQHEDAWWLEWKLTRKYQLSMIKSSWNKKQPIHISV